MTHPRQETNVRIGGMLVGYYIVRPRKARLSMRGLFVVFEQEWALWNQLSIWRGRVERFSETVEQLFLMHQPGYAPAEARKTEPVLDLGAFDRAFREFVVDQYHHRTHSETGMAPLERWSEGGFLRQLPVSLEQPWVCSC